MTEQRRTQTAKWAWILALNVALATSAAWAQAQTPAISIALTGATHYFDGGEPIVWEISSDIPAPAGGLTVEVLVAEERSLSRIFLTDPGYQVDLLPPEETGTKTVRLAQGETSASLRTRMKPDNGIHDWPWQREVDAEVQPGTGYTIAGGSAGAFILDRDRRRGAVVVKTQPAETEEGGRVYAVLELTNENGQRQRAYGYAVEVDLVGEEGANSDIRFENRTVRFERGETEKRIWIDTVDDQVVELRHPGEDVTVRILPTRHVTAGLAGGLDVGRFLDSLIGFRIHDNDVLPLVIDGPDEIVEGEPIRLVVKAEEGWTCEPEFIFRVPITIRVQDNSDNMETTEQEARFNNCSSSWEYTRPTVDNSDDRTPNGLVHITVGQPNLFRLVRGNVSGGTVILDNDGKGTNLRAANDRYELQPGLLTFRMNVLNNDEYRNGAKSELSITTVSDPETGDASVMDGEIVYSTTADATGTDTFTYTVSDGTRTDTATVTVITKPDDQPTWRAAWSTTTLTEGGSAATLTITQTNSTSTKTAPDIVTIQVGRNEGPAGPDDLEVSRNGTVIDAQTMAPTTDHQGGWVYIADDSGIDVKAQNDGIDEEAETLATWVYVEGRLAEDGRRDLTITNTASAREATPPEITGVAIEASGGDAGWSAGEKVRVTFEWNETVTVDTSGGGPAVPLTLGTAGERTATYAQGSGGDELEFTYTVTSEDGNQSSVLVAPNALALGGGTIRDSEGTDASLQHNGASRSETPIVRRDELTAEFRNAPKRHDGERFDLELHFSEEVAIGYAAMRDDALEVANGEATAAGRITSGSNRKWRIRITPSGDEDVTVTLRGQRACRAAGAVCTSDGRQLSNTITASIEGRPETLTGSFNNAPATHDGSQFSLQLDFSEEVSIGYQALRDDAIQATNGSVSGVSRRTAGSNAAWNVRVEPDGDADVSLRIDAERACRARGAVCAPDGRPLSAAITASIRGLAGISVADAATDEGPDAAVEFSVTLSRASSAAVSVDYQTVDGGAKSGQDYTAASGTLTVAPGERSKTVRVAVLDDEHDEGSETFTLRLSNPSNGKLSDGEATGTIRNRDPLPTALLARFGRAAAVHVVEQVQARMEAPREKGLRGRFAGQELAADSDPRSIVQLLSRLGQPGAGARGLAPPGDAGSGWPAAGGSITGPPGGVMLTSAPGAAGGAPAGAAAMRMQGHGIGLIEGSALAINRTDGKGGTLSFWSQGAESRFTGRDGRLGLDGDVRTTMVGTDYARGSLIVGLSIGRSWGTGSYQGVSAGRTHSAVTGVYPWLGYKFNERVSVWGVTGYGRGRLALTPQGGQTLQSPLTMRMSAAGARGLLKPDTGSGMSLAFKADALQVVTAIDAVEGPDGRLAATSASVSRVRTALEAAKRFSPGGRIGLQPSVEIGVRRDAGDAENGSGIDLGSGLIVADRDSGLSIDIRVRTVVAHQAEGFSERGVSVAVSYDPTPATPLGWTAGITPAWGGETASGSEALWARETMTGMGALHSERGNRLEGAIGYGLPVGRRWVGTPRVAFRTSEYGRDYVFGYRLGMVEQRPIQLEAGFEAEQRQRSALEERYRAFTVQATVGW